MIALDGGSRLRRIKLWILALSLIPGGVSLVLASGDYAAGFALGGAIVLLNFIGTEQIIKSFAAGGGAGSALIAVLQFFKLGVTGAIIAGILYWDVVSPVSIILGLSALPAGLMFDFFLFPTNKRDGREL
ncbi:MAG TPA: hypothetical protein ENH32_08645, partial [Proteobacteria bacterium]|nr:hypothetical protein BMS3Abin14_02169 [bacterium BMS3Abin14]HDL54028.1 hypothetical protein [Pseudomonadota bacterium]